ncbi:PREDICTED: rho GTPase-activating protein 5-like isoform X8 [Branchiostoma belcheri]|uniref:Rho GTPase-activating protein 5-like isoform X7 n=1 Tax=Branchiostoma belcheri TaxID=7741 RepID=A0A6P4XD06_BRABE|nr:PREDICTED: rho GTPase-activating protein 5-like isoform X7 [Branchiostoma belcheri]XP_019614425.1 PREDICTED: rho GTPase-activating protein 5-like isoform X8 [Branchiostoma belcheri]
MAKTKEMRTFNISVVGLSGTERDKGAQGVGKSCLCNRFVRPLADNYFHEHISVLSQSDFGGRVVNNDHFLYWGEVTKTWDEGQDFTFHVVEQTEFIDDTSFQTLRTSTFMPYIKRAAVAKVVSAEKLMYICKDQLGIEQDFEQKTMPEGKLNIDGFILVCDVSLVQNRPQEDQMRFLQNCFTNLAKTKKPALLVATKCDDAVDQYLREARDFASNRRVGIPLVETSAHENVNVDLAFVVLAQMIDKSRGKSKIIPFHEAALRRKEVLDVATEAYQNLVVRTVRDYHDTWNSVSKKLEREPDFQHYCDLLGKMSAKKLFRRHIKKLKEEHQARKQVEYLSQLPRALDALAPSLDLILDRTWPSVQNILQRQDQFEEWFVVLPDDMPWRESDHVDNLVDKRIPFDLLEMPEAETVFKNHVNKLQAAQKKERMKHEFRKLLEHTGHVLPGKPWEDVHIFLMEEESYQELTEGEKIDIYSCHQRELIDRAREDFQELLFERADLFARLDPHEQISHQDLVDIKEALQDESRYQALARLDNERDVLLLKHIGFITCPSKETCLSGPNCMENLLQNAVDTAVHRPTSWNRHSQWMFDPNASQLNIVILGADGLADELANEIKLQCNEEEYTLDGNIYSLELRPIDGDVTQPMSSFKTPKFTPNATCRRHACPTVCHDCCICVYDSVESLKYAQSSLEQTVIRSGTLSIDKKERAPFQGLPCAVILARNSANTDKDSSYLREEGQHLAERLQCPFIDVSSSEFFPNRKFQEAQIQQAMRALVESFRHREGWIGSQSIEQLMEPDIKVKLCTVCGDPYNVELPLAPLLNHQCCTAAPEKPSTLIVETFLGSCKRRVELRLTSFHSAQKYRDELVHGYILVYSAKRKASLANIRAFASSLKNVPVHILAVTESGSVNAFFTNDVEQVLITEGNALADMLSAKFSTTSSQFQKQTAVFTPFFKECWEKKESTETAYKRQPSSEDEPTDREVWDSTFGRVRPPATLPKPSRVPLPSYDEAPQNYNSDEEPPPYNGEGYHDNHHEEHLLKPSQVRDRQQQGRGEAAHYRLEGFRSPRRPPPRYHSLHHSPSLARVRKMHAASASFDHPSYESGTASSTVCSSAAIACLATLPRPPISHSDGWIDNRLYDRTASRPDMTRWHENVLYNQVRPPGNKPLPPGPKPIIPAKPIRKIKSIRGQPHGTDRQATTDSDSEYNSSLERERRDIYNKMNRRPTPKKTGKRRVPDNEGSPPPSRGPYATTDIIRNRPTGTGNSPSDDSAGTGDEFPKNAGLKKKKSFRKGTTKRRDATSPQTSDTDAISPRPAGRFAPDSAYQSDGDDEERKKRSKEQEKLERQQKKDVKRKQKEEEKLKKKMEKQKSKTKPFPLPQQKNLSGNYFGLPMEKIVQSEDNPIPLFVEMCVKYIENEGIRTEGIFRVNGKKEDTDLIRLKFDEEEITDLNDLQVADGDHKVSVNAAAGALKSFFVELPDPLIPHSVHDDLIVAISTKDDQIKVRNLKEVLRKLSPVTQAVFKYLLEHLYRVSEFSADNKMTSENLAICFMPTLMRPDFSTFDMGAQSQKILLMDNFIRLTPQIYEEAGS